MNNWILFPILTDGCQCQYKSLVEVLSDEFLPDGQKWTRKGKLMLITKSQLGCVTYEDVQYAMLNHVIHDDQEDVFV